MHCSKSNVIQTLYCNDCIYNQGNSSLETTLYSGQNTHKHAVIDDCFADVWQRVREYLPVRRGFPRYKTCPQFTIRLSLSLAIWSAVVFVNESCLCTSTPNTRIICCWLTQPALLRQMRPLRLLQRVYKIKFESYFGLRCQVRSRHLGPGYWMKWDAPRAMSVHVCCEKAGRADWV